MNTSWAISDKMLTSYWLHSEETTVDTVHAMSLHTMVEFKVLQTTRTVTGS